MCRVKSELGEDFEIIKELKLKEIRSLMIIGWEHTIQNCEELEKPINELVKLYELEGKPIIEDEK